MSQYSSAAPYAGRSIAAEAGRSSPGGAARLAAVGAVPPGRDLPIVLLGPADALPVAGGCVMGSKLIENALVSDAGLELGCETGGELKLSESAEDARESRAEVEEDAEDLNNCPRRRDSSDSGQTLSEGFTESMETGSE